MRRPLRRTYPPDPWVIRETSYERDDAVRGETVFALANGHLGLRGNVEEGDGTIDAGTYLNGFYEAAPISYGEAAYGLATHHQILLNVADGKRIELVVGDDPLDLETGSIEGYE